MFVNPRPIENRAINFALLEGYHTALMKGRYPVCCLFLELDPAAVDVNIHPAKREVKFHRESEVRRLVAQGVREALLGFHSATPALGRPVVPATWPSANMVSTAVSTPKPMAISHQKVLPNFPTQVAPADQLEPSAPAQPALPTGFSSAQPQNAPADVVQPTPAKPITSPPPAPTNSGAGSK